MATTPDGGTEDRFERQELPFRLRINLLPKHLIRAVKNKIENDGGVVKGIKHNGDGVVVLTGRARGGKLNDATFGRRMRGEGEWAETFNQLFHVTRKRVGLDRPMPELSTAAFRRPGQQLTLF